jgi:hypothetical protein
MLPIFSEFLFGLPQPLYENLGTGTSLFFDDFLSNLSNSSFTNHLPFDTTVPASDSVQKFPEANSSPEANSCSASQEIPCYESKKSISVLTISCYSFLFYVKIN